MTTPIRTDRQIARAALNDLHVCQRTLLQMEALFAAIRDAGHASTADHLVDLGLAVTGDIGNLMDGKLSSFEAWYEQVISAPHSAQSENVARNLEAQP